MVAHDKNKVKVQLQEDARRINVSVSVRSPSVASRVRAATSSEGLVSKQTPSIDPAVRGTFRRPHHQPPRSISLARSIRELK